MTKQKFFLVDYLKNVEYCPDSKKYTLSAQHLHMSLVFYILMHTI